MMLIISIVPSTYKYLFKQAKTLSYVLGKKECSVLCSTNIYFLISISYELRIMIDIESPLSQFSAFAHRGSSHRSKSAARHKFYKFYIWFGYGLDNESMHRIINVVFQKIKMCEIQLGSRGCNKSLPGISTQSQITGFTR